MKSIIKKIKNKITWYRERLFISSLVKDTLGSVLQVTNKKRIYYFLTPTHSNLGDQAQLLCWIKFFNKWYPNYDIIQIPLIAGTDEVFNAVKYSINNDDLIFIHSGYLVCDLYNNWQMLCHIVDTFPMHKITILPQTVHFISPSVQDKVASCFNRHSNLHLICRDKVSLEKAYKLFPNIDITLKPDVVTSLIGTNYINEPSQRNGVLFCMRNDAEKLYTDNQIQTLIQSIKGTFVETSDTTIFANIWDWSKKREYIIKNYLNSFAKFQVIVTDRYHGTIFSQITNTPVIVLASTDHKLQSGVDWFPKEIFGENIMFAKDLKEAYLLVLNVLSRNGAIKKNPSYFLDTYYSEVI